MSIAQVIQGGAMLASRLLSSNSAESASKSSSSSSTSSTSSSNTTNFLNLLVSQLTNQNPLEPMSNEEMVSQMATLQTVEKLDQLNEKVNSLMVYQNLMNSADLVGKQVTVTDSDTGSSVTGTVESIRIQNGFPGVVVGGNFYDISNVQVIK